MESPALVVRTSAKVNFTLDITTRRADGYHELRSVVHTVGLWDELSFWPSTTGSWRLDCSVPSLETPDNLVLEAARAWEAAAREGGMEGPCGGHFFLDKHIPFGAGLGGGSGNAAGVLQALRSFYDPEDQFVPEDRMHAVAARLGADVPLFLRGGAALMEGIGEKLTPLAPLRAWLVIAQGSRTISTPEAYRAWDAQQKPSAHATASMLEAWPPEDARVDEANLTLLASRLHNDLSGVAQSLGVEVEPIVAAMNECGALGAEMTGSGSAVFGLFASKGSALMAASQVLDAFPCGDLRCWAASLSPQGVIVSSA
jgi:4-diphosphocytidyl-2-C-methyl-D-erythritol kinase